MGGRNSVVAAATAAIAAATVLALFRWALYPHRPKTIAGPLRSVLPNLSSEQLARLDYPPDIFPGARDVQTPVSGSCPSRFVTVVSGDSPGPNLSSIQYGSIRVYEFGPMTGRKVLMVHGISTSCQTLGRIARQLVDCAGCRVMLFDLFGRGFSDGVGDLPHDERLYCSQMLCALASSPLSWTGEDAFDLLGYSMGGGVAVHFATAFHGMIRSLILLAPAGLIRPQRFGVAARLIFTSGIIPERLLSSVTRRRLRRPLASGQKARQQRLSLTKTPPGATVASEETSTVMGMAAKEATDPNGIALETHQPETQGVVWSMQVGRYVRWMLSHHDGFIPAFMSCIRYAPLVGQNISWSELARLVCGKDKARNGRSLPLCVILGHHDDVVDASDYEIDALPLFSGPGFENMTWTVVPGGHDFPMTYSRHVLRVVFGFWEEKDDTLMRLQAQNDREMAMGKEEKNTYPVAMASKPDGDTADNDTCKLAAMESIL